jgi:hypothetical protein
MVIREEMKICPRCGHSFPVRVYVAHAWYEKP